MMAACVVQKSRQLWTGSKMHSSKVLGILVGTLTLGLAAQAHAQACNPVQAAKLLAADGAGWDELGFSVSISGDTAVIGVPKHDDNGSNSGSAYIYTRSGGGGWTQQAELLPADGSANDWFGYFVFISGDKAVIGAPSDDDNGSFSGSAYVFARSGGVWTQQAKLLPGDGAASDRFGWSVSISGDTAIIGADQDNNGLPTGSAYVFTRSGGAGGVWTEQAKIIASDGAAWDNFGYSVSISSDTVIIGARMDDDNGRDSGSAYVFDLNCGPCPADLNGDGALDVLDFFAFITLFAASDPAADMNNDGNIDVLDFFAFINLFAAGCP